VFVKYVTYEAGAGPRVGVLDGAQIVDVDFSGDMVAFINAGAPHGRWTAVSADAKLLAPLRPHSMRDFLQFKGHLDNALTRLGRAVPPEFYTVPAYYKGMPDTVIGPDEIIPWPAYTNRLDFELELGCVIGTRGADISLARARDHIFGWTIWNDVSARDTQVSELPLGLGPAKAKDWDGSNILGPCIVTADEVDGGELNMRVVVNEELWGEANSSAMQHSFEQLIVYAAQSQCLYPGELFGSGTATGGSGLEVDRWVQSGDEVKLEIEGIGTLCNIIGQKGK